MHGALVPPGAAEALAAAIRDALADRDKVADIGQRNAELVHRNCRQTHYGDALERLYGSPDVERDQMTQTRS